MNVPWVKTRRNFASKHLRVRVAGRARYWIWQATMAGPASDARNCVYRDSGKAE